MIFRPLIADVRRAGLIGFVCLAGVCISRAGDEQGRQIEVVPAHNGEVNPNVNETPLEPADLDKVVPGAAHAFNPLDDASPEPPAPFKPQESRPLTQREQESFDRRRDWVFMTPEELVSQGEADTLLGIKDNDKNGLTAEKKATSTALERYYQHLLDSDHPALTNKISRDWVSDSWDKDTNSTTTGDQNEIEFSQRPFDNPLNSRPDQGIFKQTRPDSFSDVFDSSTTDNTAQTEDAIRAQQELEAHMDAFKQMWNIDQPASVSSKPVSTDSDASGPAFGSLQPVFGAAAPSLGGSSSQQSSSPPQETLSSERSTSTGMLMHAPQFNNQLRSGF